MSSRLLAGWVSPASRNSFFARWSEKSRSEFERRRKKRLSQSSKAHPIISRLRPRNCENTRSGPLPACSVYGNSRASSSWMA